ncbi:MAG: cache domain-containing protein [Spirochaetaceae bacterium]|nr:cache domain-containing protein [Spirochaetaceae bacterium]
MNANYKKKKPVFLLMGAVLSIIFVAVALSSTLYLIQFRAVSTEKIKEEVNELVSQLSYTVSERCGQWSKLVKSATISAAPIMASKPVDETVLHDLFARIQATQKDIVLIYCTGNEVWYDEGGFAAFSTDWRPDKNWDNTTRAWYKGAKEKNGKVSFARPYVDAATGKLTTAISVNTYYNGEDVGVVSGNVSIYFLDELLAGFSSFAEQESYFINLDGFFVTNSDPEAVLKKDFFEEKQLEHFREQILESKENLQISGRDYLIFSAYIPDVEWHLVSIIPVRGIFGEVNMIVISLIVFCTLAGVLAIVATCSAANSYAAHRKGSQGER